MRANPQIIGLVTDVIRSASHTATRDGKIEVAISQRVTPDVWRLYSSTLTTAGGRYMTKRQVFVFPADTDTRAELARYAEMLTTGDTNPHDYFPTPDAAADQVVDTVLAGDTLPYLERNPTERIKFLEPSVGTGALLRALFRRLPRERVDVIAFEVDPGRRATLQREMGITAIGTDFLAAKPDCKVDLVLMNPPFNGPKGPDTWAHHVQHALTWLGPEKNLGAIVSPRLTTLRDRKSNDLVLDLHALASASGSIETLEAGTFAQKGTRGPKTTLETRILHIANPSEPDWRLKPTGGWSNWYTLTTALVVRNNNIALLEETTLDGENPRTLKQVRAGLLANRAQWIQHGAPWLSTAVDLDELARGVTRDFEPPCEERAPKAPRRKADQSTRALKLVPGPAKNAAPLLAFLPATACQGDLFADAA